MTSTAIVPVAAAQALRNFVPVEEQAREYAKNSRSKSTIRSYTLGWKHFSAWSIDAGRYPLPATPETVSLYLASMASDLKVSTIQLRMAAISQTHQLKGFESPTKSEIVRTVLKGIRRTLGTAPTKRRAPLITTDVREMVGRLPDTLLGARDRALLLLGFAGAFRRSELVGIDFEDLTFTSDGLVVLLRRSKTDQEENAGRNVGVPHLAHSDACPVGAVRGWLRSIGHQVRSAFSKRCGQQPVTGRTPL